MTDNDDLGLGDVESGFLDVSANALAVIIMATLFVIILSTQPPISGDAPADEKAEGVVMPARLETSFAPLSQYFVVVRQGVAPLDLTEFARASLSDGQPARTRAGSLSLITPRTARRDYDEYSGFVTLDLAALVGSAAPLGTPDAVLAAADAVEARHAQSAFVPTYVVYPDGIPAFAPLYHALRARGVPLRWFILTAGEPLRFSHRPEDFETRSRRW